MLIDLYWFCVQLGRLGCHTSFRHEEECVWQHWRSCRACAHGDSYWSSGKILSSTQNVMWSRFQSYHSWIRRFVLQCGVFSAMTCILSPAVWWHVTWQRFVTVCFHCSVLVFTQYRLVSCYGPIGCLKMSVRNYRSELRKIPGECRSLSAFTCLNA